MPNTVKEANLEKEREQLIQAYEHMAKNDYAKIVDMAYHMDVGEPHFEIKIDVSGDSSAQFEPDPS